MAWTTLLSTLVAAYDPGAASMLPTHSHTALSGIVPAHTHTASEGIPTDSSGACTVAAGTETDGSTLACGVDNTVGPGALLVPNGPIGLIAASGSLATVIEVTTRPLGIAPRLLTPPPRN